MTKTSIRQADNRYTEWLSYLDIFDQELNFFKSHLDMIAGSNPDKAVTSQIATYNSRIKEQKQNIHRLRRGINKGLEEIEARSALDGEFYAQGKMLQQQEELAKKFHDEMKEVNRLKADFNQFSASRL